MAKPPDSTKTSCQQRLAGRARERWPQLASHDGYDKSLLPTGLPSGTPQETLDYACGLYLGDAPAWTHPSSPTN